MKLDEIINSWENRPQAFTGQKTDVATFIGPNSDLWNPNMLAKAIEMEGQGKHNYSAEDIWRETGTGRGLDGEWRQEISDHKARLTNPMGIKGFLDRNKNEGGDSDYELSSLNQYIDHDKLWDAYEGIGFSSAILSPGTQDDPYGVHYPGGLGGEGENSPTGFAAFNQEGMDLVRRIHGGDADFKHEDGFYDVDVNSKTFPPNRLQKPSLEKLYKNMSEPNLTLFGGKGQSRDDIFSTILHENQHSIQGLEGWGDGIGNEDWYNFVNRDQYASQLLEDQYKGLAWEDANGNYTIPFSDISLEDKNFQAYLHQPVEAEARLTQAREALDEKERREYFPFNKKTLQNPYGYDVNPEAVKGLLESFNNR